MVDIIDSTPSEPFDIVTPLLNVKRNLPSPPFLEKMSYTLPAVVVS